MSCEVTVLADSVAPNGSRLITFECVYPARIHWDVMTHRMFSRNAMSTRAIPWLKMREWIVGNPYIPIHWGANRKGMAPGAGLSGWRSRLARWAWLGAMRAAVLAAGLMHRCGCHKSLVNAVVIPWMHMRVVITSGEDGLCNWWHLRLHHAAAPEIQQLAKRMAEAANASTPRKLPGGEWHLPYITDAERAVRPDNDLVIMSAARCARVTFTTFEGKPPDFEGDVATYAKLVGEDPKHATPTEHQAQAYSADVRSLLSGNLPVGWTQARKMLPGERATKDTFDLAARLALYGENDYLLSEPAR